MRGAISGMTMEDLWHLLVSHGGAVIAALVFLIVCLMLLQSRLSRSRNGRAESQAAGTFINGAEKFGPFLRFTSREFVRLLLECERDGMQVAVFTHSIPPSAESEEEATVTTIASFASSDLILPAAFQLSPAAAAAPVVIEAAVKMIAAALRPLLGPGYPEIEIPEHPRFRQLYTLRSESADTIREVFDTRLITFFESRAGWTVEALNGCLFVCRDGIEEPLQRIQRFLREAQPIADALRRSSK